MTSIYFLIVCLAFLYAAVIVAEIIHFKYREHKKLSKLKTKLK